MAVVPSILGRVDPTIANVGATGQPTDASGFLVDVTIQAADYTAGFLTTALLASLGVTAILGVAVLGVRTAAGPDTQLLVFGAHDIKNSRVRAFTTSAGPVFVDYTPTNGDVFRLWVVAV